MCENKNPRGCFFLPFKFDITSSLNYHIVFALSVAFCHFFVNVEKQNYTDNINNRKEFNFCVKNIYIINIVINTP